MAIRSTERHSHVPAVLNRIGIRRRLPQLWLSSTSPLPPGEDRSEAAGTVGPCGTHPDTDYPPSSSPKPHHLHGGAIAGIVIGVITFNCLCVTGVLLSIRRRWRHRGVGTEDEKQHKPEMGSTGTYVDGCDPCSSYAARRVSL